jgi:hypothetical protein
MDSPFIKVLNLILGLLSAIIAFVVGVVLMWTADGAFTTQFGVGLLLVGTTCHWLPDR